MMSLTRKGEYAVRGMVHLAKQKIGGMSLLPDIAEAVDAPAPFLAKIFQSFAKQGIVTSVRGAKGGFALGRPAGEITLLEIVEAVEGPVMPNRCLVGRGTCENDAVCGVHPVWRSVQSQIVKILGGVTLAEMARGRKGGSRWTSCP